MHAFATVSYTHLTLADDLTRVDLGGRRIIKFTLGQPMRFQYVDMSWEFRSVSRKLVVLLTWAERFDVRIKHICRPDTTQPTDTTTIGFVPANSWQARTQIIPAAGCFELVDCQVGLLNACFHVQVTDWVRLNVPPTQYRSYGDGFLRVKWPNQQCQSIHVKYQLLRDKTFT